MIPVTLERHSSNYAEKTCQIGNVRGHGHSLKNSESNWQGKIQLKKSFDFLFSKLNEKYVMFLFLAIPPE